MNKKTIIILVTIVVVGLIVGIVAGVMENKKEIAPNSTIENEGNLTVPNSTIENEENSTVPNLTIKSAEDLTALVDQIYDGLSIEMPMLQTMPVDTSDVDSVKKFTGLNTAENLEYVVASEPMMSSQAYSMVLLKVKDGTDANAVAKSINENVNESKWICVTAEKVYTTSSGNVVCLVMTNEETAKPVFEKFKTLAGTVGQVYERSAEEIELPPEMY